MANSWVKSFFENRKQYVNLPGHSSSVKTVTCGIPQGSKLGPLLFFFFLNDLQSVFSKSVVRIILQMTLTVYNLPKNLVQLNPSLTMN